VVYSLNRMITPPPGFKGGAAGCLKETTVSASANSTYEVAVQLKAPALSFLQCLAMAYIRIMPKHIIEPIDTNEGSRELKQSELIGSGPFKFKSYQTGSTWVLERNPDYYLKGQPYLDGITYYIIPDLNTRLAGFRANQLELMKPTEALSPSQVKQLQADMKDQVVVKEANNARLIGLFFNTKTGPFTDVRLRRAANLAINRQSMIDLLFEGEGSITTPICTCWPYIYDEAYYLTQPGYRADKTADLAQAKQLVNDATGGKGAEVVLTVANIPPYPDYAQFVQQQLNDVGFRVTLNPMENAVAQQRYGDGQFEAAVHPGAVPFLDPDSMITRYFLPSGDRNWARWTNQEFNDLFAKESVNNNADERAKQLRRMVDILQDEVPVVGLPDTLLISPMSPKVQGLDKMPTTVNADLRFDWVWLK
jgi:peptide/nickel transport system substrate-binding protein